MAETIPGSGARPVRSAQAAGLALLSEALVPQRTVFVDDLWHRSVRDIGEYHVLDARLKALLRASIEENVVAILHVLEHDIDPLALDAPPSAIAYARRLAQHDVPLSALLRNYRIGLADFLQMAMSMAEGSVAAGSLAAESVPQRQGEAAPASLMMVLVQRVSSYIDAVSEQVASAYEAERDRWVHRHGALLGQHLAQVLAEPVMDEAAAERGLGYRLAQTHLAIVAWADPAGEGEGALTDPDGLLHALAEALGIRSPGLAVPADEREVWLWLPVAESISSDVEALTGVAQRMGVRLAVGTPQLGVMGFRQSHRQAQQVKGTVLQASGVAHRVTTFADVGPIALLAHDVEALRAWVGQVLGPLAEDAERQRWLRESLLVFLECNGSYAAAADRLHLHRNTVHYRVQQAEELRGRPVGDDRLQVQLALTAVRWLGSTTLRRPPM